MLACICSVFMGRMFRQHNKDNEYFSIFTVLFALFALAQNGAGDIETGFGEDGIVAGLCGLMLCFPSGGAPGADFLVYEPLLAVFSNLLGKFRQGLFAESRAQLTFPHSYDLPSLDLQ